MSDKHVSGKTSKPSLDDLANSEMDSASNALFDEFSQGARQLFRGALQFAERTHDGGATFLSAFMGEKSAEDHTKDLEKEAARALKQGDLNAAKHFLKRDIAFTMGTQGYDDEDSLRLLKELEVLQKAEKQRDKERAAEKKSVKPSKSTHLTTALAELMLSGS